ncbi:fumarylacetoacetate hydrolase family protein [Lacticaseibacillus baoqingensis]|uniref:Fumarylacetoacetate hydrolase family protein n=1 Tax=Lacticaseibacillus baoqingensis TaxID=2486013 RepID=A0ABW4EAF1_9LACO|nr:fumarylacetoacetate hydrolase family protein [Lacticaseibacillus baoqingensis]
MKIITYIDNDTEKVGLVSNDGQRVFPIKTLGYAFESVNALIDGADDATWAKLKRLVNDPQQTGAIAFDQVKLTAPIPHPKRDVLALGLNYIDHVNEVAKYMDEDPAKRAEPIFFAKHVDRAVGEGEATPAHADFISSWDYEVELTVVLKKEINHFVKPEAVEDYILGYTIVNDMTARELRKHVESFFQKSLDGSTTMGPWIVTADELPFPPAKRIRLWVNDELRQESNTGNLVFSIAECLSTLSKGMTLRAGEILATGTPNGVGAGMVPENYLKAGDHIKSEIDGIGQLNINVKD